MAPRRWGSGTAGGANENETTKNPKVRGWESEGGRYQILEQRRERIDVGGYPRSGSKSIGHLLVSGANNVV